MLVTDTNVLARCSRGKAMVRALELNETNIVLATTRHNMIELQDRLIHVFGLDEQGAIAEVARMERVFEVLDAVEYEHHRFQAWSRLGVGGKSDWPPLAAALAFDCEIWTDDRDFFGVGVPVWSTHNVAFVERAGHD